MHRVPLPASAAMARLAVAAVLLTLLLVALCRVIDGEAPHTAASTYYPSDLPEDAAVPAYANGEAYVEYTGDAGTSVAFVPPYLDGAARDEAAAAAVQSYVLPAEKAAMSPEGPVIPVDDADQAFLRFPCHHRHMRWARLHGGLHHRQDVYGGFHRHGEEDQEKRLAEVAVELVYSGKSSKRVLPPVAEPDPDAAEELFRKPAFRDEEEDGDEMARAWRRKFHHHHQDEQEDHDHDQADEVSPVKRFRSHHHHDEESETRTKRFHHHHHHHHRDKDDDEDELEEMARRWIRKALMRSRIHHHHLSFRHRAEDAAAGEEEEEEKGGVMSWLKDFVNRF